MRRRRTAKQLRLYLESLADHVKTLSREMPEDRCIVEDLRAGDVIVSRCTMPDYCEEQ